MNLIIRNGVDPSTDGDGQSDSSEIQWGTDPTDPDSKNELLWQLPLISGITGIIIGIYFLYKKSKIWQLHRILKISKKK